MTERATIRVVVADDDPTLRKVLAEIIRLDDGLELVGTAPDAEAAVLCCVATRPDVALVDVKMPRGGGPVAMRGIRSWSPLTRLVALSGYDDRATVLEMLRAGAAGYLVKGAPPEEIVAAVRSAAEGRGILSQELASDVVSELAGRLRGADATDQRREHRRARVRRTIGERTVAPALQPIVDLRGHAVVGHEALARFPRGDWTGPREFFGEAWKVELGVEAEICAAEAALDLLGRLPGGTYLAINLSPRTILEVGVPTIPRGLAEAGRVVVEITEHARVEDYPKLADALAAFRGAGGRIAVDDVGAGYASLRHMLELEPDVIKLDVSLTRGIHADAKKRALATALVSFSRAAGATLVGEGIEYREELEALRDLGVRYGQGFHLGMPRPAEVALRAPPSPEPQGPCAVPPLSPFGRYPAERTRIGR